ncbi:hypothetical protein GGF32_002719 [Allomyces javanicus]|nr:hypothetical protein GGF32_002719 [Allomyces javanicus]
MSAAQSAYNQIHVRNPLDAYLAEPPEGTLFADPFRRVPRHARHTSQLVSNEAVDFDRTITFDVPRGGDLLSGLALYFKLPALTSVRPSDSTFLGWTQSIAYSMIKRVELTMGQRVILSTTGMAMDILDDLTATSGKADALARMTGRYDSEALLGQNALDTLEVFLPFHFWFTRKIAHGLPLWLLRSNVGIQIRVELRPFSELVTYDGDEEPMALKPLDALLYADYTMLSDTDKEENYSFDETFDVVMEQYQTHVFQHIRANTAQAAINLDLTNAVKEILWVCTEVESQKNNDWFNYGWRDRGGAALIKTAGLTLDGSVRVERLPESFFRNFNVYRHHSHLPNRNVYCYSFAENPESHQVSGYLNASNYDYVTLALTFHEGVPESFVYVVGVSYNVLKIDKAGNVHLEYL